MSSGDHGHGAEDRAPGRVHHRDGRLERRAVRGKAHCRRLAELDAAAPNHPVIVYQAFTGPAATNSQGQGFFTSKGVAVRRTGAIAANAPSVAALNALRSVQTFEDQKRGTMDAMAYAASVGVTTSVDMGAFVIPGTGRHPGFVHLRRPGQRESRSACTTRSSRCTAKSKMTTRLRIFFLSMDTRPDVPMLKQRLRNILPGLRRRHAEAFRHRRVRHAVAAVRPTVTPPANYATALKLVAKQGWAFQQHSLSLAEDQLTATTFEEVNADHADRESALVRRARAAHRPGDSEPLQGDGRGIAVHPFEYLAGGRGTPGRRCA